MKNTTSSVRQASPALALAPAPTNAPARAQGMTIMRAIKLATMRAITSTVHTTLRLLVLLFILLAIGMPARAANNAAFSSQSVPATMLPGASATVTVVMTNNGTTTWSAGALYRLGAQNPQDNYTWMSGNRVALARAVAPGQSATFSFGVTAPTKAGTYNFQWKMVQDFVEWFGAPTPNLTVVVAAPVLRNDAQVIAVNVPVSMTQGQRYAIAVTMRNSGTTTWAGGGAYSLGSTNPNDNEVWGVKRAAVGAAVAPGQQVTFNLSVLAPPAGRYTMSWGMVQEYVAWFGPSSESVVTVSGPPASAPTIRVARTPSPMTAGQAYTLTWSSTNATSVSRSCTASGTGYTVSDTLAANGTASGTASAAWVGYPSTCVWRAAGAGGTASFTEVMTTNAAPSVEVVTYFHTDGLGSPVARSNAAGQMVANTSRTRYEPYGLTTSGTTSTIGFTGHVNDAETGLVYMQQRYYDPVAGRFLSIDPVTTDANTGGSFNRYAYANNSPYKYIDQDGRSIDEVTKVEFGHVKINECGKSCQINRFDEKSYRGTNGVDPNTRGDYAVNIVADDLTAQGFIILGRQVTATTTGLDYTRRYDLLVKNSLNNNIFGVEVKSGMFGTFKLDGRQLDFDANVIKNGAITKNLIYFNGIMYRGVALGSGVNVIYANKKLIDKMAENEIPFSFSKPPAMP